MIASLILGAVVGLVMGLTGAGGGILAVPLLLFGLHMSIAAAGPIGLLAVGIAAAIGAAVALRKGIVRYKAALLISVTGMLVAPLGSWLAHRLDTRVLGAVFALVLLRVAYKNLREGRLGHADTVAQAELPCIRSSAHGRFIWTSQCALRLSGMGIVAGLLSGLLGVGGGFVIVPALQRYTDLAMQSVVATSLAVIALISLSGVASSVLGGRFDYALGLPFAAGAVAGMLVGGRLAARYHPRHLKTAFGLVCFVVAVGLLARSVL